MFPSNNREDSGDAKEDKGADRKNDKNEYPKENSTGEGGDGKVADDKPHNGDDRDEKGNLEHEHEHPTTLLEKTTTTNAESLETVDTATTIAEPILLKDAPYPRRGQAGQDVHGRDNNHHPRSIGIVEQGPGGMRAFGGAAGPPHTPRTLQYARTLSIQPTDTSRSLSRMRTIERQNTISLGSGPRKANEGARAVAEFRTLSIAVTEHRRKVASSKKEKKKEKEKKKKETEEVEEKEKEALAQLDFHTVSANVLLERFSVSQKLGLDSDQASRRLITNGPNKITPHRTNYVKKYLGYIFGGFGTLLFGGSILAFISWKPLGEPAPQISNLALAIILLLVIVLQTVFNAWQDYSTSRTMASISGMLPTDILVLRDGQQKNIHAEDLVTGDIVTIKLGDKIPADVRFIDVSSDLKLDRSILTGESEAVPGTINGTDDNFLETKNIGLQGTLCVGGAASGLVVQTGDRTVFGRIAKLSTGDRHKPTTLQVEITRFVYLICSLAAAIALIVVIAWAAWLDRHHKGFITPATLVIDIVSVAIAFIPEGLPFAVTLSLSIIAGRLAAKKVLCKTLPIVESLGCVSVLCSDKTGTLTKNIMTVVNFSIFDTQYNTLEGRDLMTRNDPKSSPIHQFAAIAGVCNGATFDPTTMDHPIETRLINGDGTDSAILRFAEMLKPVAQSNAEWVTLFKMAFSSKTKYMLKIVSPKVHTAGSKILPPLMRDNGFDYDDDDEDASPSSEEEDDLVLLCKGAPDVLLGRCSYILDSDGNRLPLDEANTARLIAKQKEWASRGQRVLLLAKRILHRLDLPKGLSYDAPEFADHVASDLNQKLTIVGLLGLVDPPKDDIPLTIATLRDAYIRVFMVTGDFPLTAVAIAEQVGIVTNAKTIHHLSDLNPALNTESISHYDLDHRPEIPSAVVLSGSDLLTMNESQWEQACQYEEIVFARTTPEQKLRIVKEFQARSNVVAMTGDGVNDAPSLKAADVGLAVGSQASDVAIEAADLVLLEDFSAIVSGVEYGRLVFDNLKKSILYLLPAGSFSELVPLLLNVFLGVPQIISNIQMLLICCLSDLFMSVALCYERPEEGLLLRKPRDVKKDRLVDVRLMVQAYSFGIIECLCSSAMGFWYLERQGIPFSALVFHYGGWGNGLDPGFVAEKVNTAQSIYYFTLVIMQWGNALAVRTRRLSILQHPPFFNPNTANYYLIPAMFAAAAVAFFFLYVPVFQNIFLTRHIPVEYIFIPFGFALGILLIDEARKFCVRRYPRGLLAKMAW